MLFKLLELLGQHLQGEVGRVRLVGKLRHVKWASELRILLLLVASRKQSVDMGIVPRRRIFNAVHGHVLGWWCWWPRHS